MNAREERIRREASYMIETNDTVREIAKKFCVSKSTVHKDLHERLRTIDYELYIKIDEILKYHTKIRHIRGGEATRKKYIEKDC